jgi:alpha-1,2-mannosyltransferase
MHAIWQRFGTGAWLTLSRIRGYSIIVLIVYCVASALWIASAHNLVDRNNKPIGTDFSNVYAAGILADTGKPEAAYDWPSEHTVEQSLFGQDTPFFGWHYPPQFLMVAAVLAFVSYGWALALWMVTTLSAYVVTIRAILPQSVAVLAALAYAAVFVNLGHGQNGFLTAALLGGALVLMDRRPVVSGVLIGLLAYKPQFGVLLPVVLIASGRWTVVGAAVCTVFVTCVATLALFGTKVWIAFEASAGLTRRIVLEEGSTGWEKIQSAFSAVRMWGGSVDLAYAVQGALALSVAAGLVWLWRSEASFDLKGSALAVSALLTTPYVLDYDLMLLAVAIAFYVRHGLARGFQHFEISLLAFVWIVPLFSRPLAGVTGIPLGLIAQVVLLVVVFRRAWREVSPSQGGVLLVPA